jgi:hypothetical protein
MDDFNSDIIKDGAVI